MDTAGFWRLIEASKAGVYDNVEEQASALTRTLVPLKPDDILDFAKQFDACMAAAYSWDLWAAAFIINSGCSDDGFEYFRAWLIAQGQRAFEAALKDPESLGTIADPDADGEPMLYVAGEAYEENTGQPLPAFKSAVPAEPTGTPWEEDAVNERFPGLAAKFG